MRTNLIVIMRNVFKIVLFFVFISLVASCNTNDDPEPTPLRDYAEQYAADLATIQTFLKTHSYSVINNPGGNDDQNVTFTVVPELDPTSIWGTNATTHNANVLELPVEKDGFTYIIYYLQLRQGSGPNSKSPCNLDGVLAAYKGQLMDDEMTVFDSNFFPQSYFSLSGVIRGWSEVFPKFKTGSYVGNVDGSITYSNFGAGVMFLPSGLAYFGSGTAGISPYSPLIFSFKLYEVQRIDNDFDGIPSYLEDNGDGYIRDNDTTFEDDTDQDGIPDAFDVDDDGDNVMTKDEIKYTLLGNTYSYPFNGALVDDPVTPQDETKGIPNCGSSPDYTTPTRLRKHLDPSCQ